MRISDPACLAAEGPLLIAANHPNSFLDAILLASLFNKPIYSLARGDAFANSFFTRLLTSMHILPVYRMSEGAQNLTTNYDTFSTCQSIFRKGGIVLIFSEGLCINEWKLRPLKKGTARLAISCWKEGIPLRVLPTGINYHSFRSYGKSVRLNFGKQITQDCIDLTATEGQSIRQFNETLNQQLLPLVDHFDNETDVLRANHYHHPVSVTKKFLLRLPALLGKGLHAPLYLPLRQIARKKAAPDGHYDAVLIGLLFLLYPVYLLGIAVCLYLWTGHPLAFTAICLMPLLAWSWVCLKNR